VPFDHIFRICKWSLHNIFVTCQTDLNSPAYNLCVWLSVPRERDGDGEGERERESMQEVPGEETTTINWHSE